MASNCINLEERQMNGFEQSMKQSLVRTKKIYF